MYVCTSTHRFVSKMPTPTLFIVFSLLLKAVEAIGVTMFITASYTLLTGLYLDRKGTLVVSILAIALLLFKQHIHLDDHHAELTFKTVW